MNLDINYWVLQTLAMMLTCLLIPNLKVSGPIPALATVVSIGFINAHYWSAALFFSLPDSPTTQAGVLLLMNGVIFWVVVKVLPGIEVSGVFPALAAPIVFTLCNVGINMYLKDVDWPAVFQMTMQFLVEMRDKFMGSAPVPSGPIQQ